MIDKIRDNKLIIRTANGALNLLSGEIVKVLKDKFEREDFYASCYTCSHSENQNMLYQDKKVPITYCKKYQAYPPLQILVNSCEGYDDNDDIPF